MKLDKAFFDKIHNELKKKERSYRIKILLPAILGSIALVFAIFNPWMFVFGTERFIAIITWVIFGAFFFYIAKMLSLSSRTETEIFKKITKDNNGTYDDIVYLGGEKSAMLRRGKGRIPTGSNVISFTGDNGEHVRFFDLFFRNPDDAPGHEYSYKVVGVSGLGEVPHMYLNYRHNSYTMYIGRKLNLNAEFDKHFTLSIADGYHIEALQIFTPDVIQRIIELPFKFDMEFVDGEILFFIDKKIGNPFDFNKFIEQMDNIKKIVDLFRKNLGTTRWSQIGDKPSVM